MSRRPLFPPSAPRDLRGTDRFDVLVGGGGDDRLAGLGGCDILIGGSGTDTAVYAGAIAEYEVDRFGASVRVHDLATGDRDLLVGVEQLYFAVDDYTALLGGANNVVAARDDRVAASALGPVTLTGLLANDLDFDGDALAITAIDTTGLTGTATLNANGTVTYDAAGAFDALAEGQAATTTLTYAVSDGRGSSDTATVTITVAGVNDAPVLTAPTAVTVAENSAGAVLGAAASDVDAGDTVGYSLTGADAALFAIEGDGTLRFVTPPDFETPADAGSDNVYDVTIVATDAGGLSDRQAVQVTVADVAETPPLVINEIHYDNAGTDTGEFIEIAGAPGTDLTGWTLVLYNGSGGSPYRTIALTGTLNAAGVASVAAAGLQNGSPDGIALVAPNGSVAEFLSYEGAFTAVGGPADGLTSTDIGVSEPSDTPEGQSLQRLADGGWTGPVAATRDAANDGPAATAVHLNEFHYDNDGTDTGEFIEVAGTAGADLTGWTLVLYNGNGGAPYQTIALAGALSGTTGEGYASVDAPGVQNGAPDGIALVRPDGTVAEFLSYEGAFSAVGGPADGLTSTDIGVSEPSATPAGLSLQRQSDGTWAGPAPATRNAANDGGDTGGPGDGVTLISAIQGAGAASALVGQTVIVHAVVTALASNGYWLQEEDAQSDGNAATSEGLFVFTSTAPVVQTATLVSVTGTVAEFFGQTQITQTAWSLLDAAAGLPQAATLTLPFTAETSLEATEGMRVSLTATGAPLTVISNFNLDRFGEIVVSAGTQVQPTQIYDAQTEAAQIDALQAANALNRIVLDDGNGRQNPTEFRYVPNLTAGDNGNGYLDAGDSFTADGPTLRIGAQITEPVTGMLTYGFDAWRVVPTETLVIDPASNDRPDTPPEVAGTLRAVSFNALNYFTTLGERGATTESDLARQTEKLVNALEALDGDIIALQEVENNGFGAGSAVQTLVDALNVRLGSPVYAVVDVGGPLGTDAISNAIIYRPDAVSVTGSAVLVFDDDGSQLNRPAIAATFEDAAGERLTVVANHFKSKGGAPADATDPNADSGDGQGAWNAARTAAAQQLADWLRTNPTGSDDPDVLILGDLNAYSQEDPVQALEAAGYANLLEDFIGAEDAFSFVFDGQQGALDQALASEALVAQVTGVAEWHINAEEPDLLGYSSRFTDARFYNGDDPFAASDHDPLIVGLTLGSDGLLTA